MINGLNPGSTYATDNNNDFEQKFISEGYSDVFFHHLELAVIYTFVRILLPRFSIFFFICLRTTSVHYYSFTNWLNLIWIDWILFTFTIYTKHLIWYSYIKTNSKSLNPITYGGGVLKTQIAFDAHFDPLGSKLSADTFWQFLTIPIYHFRAIEKVGKKFHFRGEKNFWNFYNGPGLKDPPHRSTLIRTPIDYRVNYTFKYT